MTLREQVIKKIDIMPDEQVRQLLQFADFLFYVNPQIPEDQNVAMPHKKHCRKLKGIMPGKMVMAKDFDETPDCFKEYI